MSTWESGRSSAEFGGVVLSSVSGIVAAVVSSWRCCAAHPCSVVYVQAPVLVDGFRRPRSRWLRCPFRAVRCPFEGIGEAV